MECVAAQKKEGVFHVFTQRIVTEMIAQTGEKLLQKRFGDEFSAKIDVIGEKANIDNEKIV